MNIADFDYPEDAFLFSYIGVGVFVQVPDEPTSSYLTFSGRPAEVSSPCGTSTLDGPLSDELLRKFLDEGGFKPAEKVWRVGDIVKGSEAYESLPIGAKLACGAAWDAASLTRVESGISDHWGTVLPAADHWSPRVIVALPGVSEEVVEAAKKARLAYWESLGEPRKSEPKPASLAAWIAAVQAVKPSLEPEPVKRKPLAVGDKTRDAQDNADLPVGSQLGQLYSDGYFEKVSDIVRRFYK